MSQLFEVAMVLSFGAAWPTSIAKSIKAGTTKGKSLFFLLIVAFGYVCGILAKFTSGNLNYVVVFYILNLLMVCTDIVIYFINLRKDKQSGTFEP